MRNESDGFRAGIGTHRREELLEPTRIIVRPVKRILAHYPIKRRVIKGWRTSPAGGLVDNLPAHPSAPPPGVFVNRGSWPIPPVFPWLHKLGDIALADWTRVQSRNRFVMIVSPFYAESIMKQLAEDSGENLDHRRRSLKANPAGMGLGARNVNVWTTFSLNLDRALDDLIRIEILPGPCASRRDA